MQTQTTDANLILISVAQIVLAAFFGGLITYPVTAFLQKWKQRSETISALAVLSDTLPTTSEHNLSAVRNPTIAPAEIVPLTYPTAPFEGALFGQEETSFDKVTQFAITRYLEKAGELNAVILQLQNIHFEDDTPKRNTARRFLLTQLEPEMKLRENESKTDPQFMPQRIERIINCLEAEKRKHIFDLI